MVASLARTQALHGANDGDGAPTPQKKVQHRVHRALGSGLVLIEVQSKLPGGFVRVDVQTDSGNAFGNSIAHAQREVGVDLVLSESDRRTALPNRLGGVGKDQVHLLL